MHRLIVKQQRVEIGRRFGSRVVRGVEFWIRQTSGHRQRTVVCRCDCGQVDAVTVCSLLKGKSLACPRCSHHGQWNGLSRMSPREKDSLYSVWLAMRKRCNDPRFKYFRHYGGRGIAVCEEWSRDYLAFREWAMSHGWKRGLHIDRINNNGGYSPENCRFVTVRVNQRNRRNTVMATAFGETKPLIEWSEDERCLVWLACLYDRIVKRGMNPEDVLFLGKMKTGKKTRSQEVVL